MNLALAPFTRDEFVQLRTLMVKLVDHLQSLATPSAAQSRRTTPRAAAKTTKRRPRSR
jgi:hypothetical protein